MPSGSPSRLMGLRFQVDVQQQVEDVLKKIAERVEALARRQVITSTKPAFGLEWGCSDLLACVISSREKVFRKTCASPSAVQCSNLLG